MDILKLGVIIQGPIVTFGQGGNVSTQGFNSSETILENINTLSPYVDSIVVSTWFDSGLILTIPQKANVFMIESMPPERDFDNRRKQFVSTAVGFNYLVKNRDCNYFLKVRTDQLIPIEIVNYISLIFKDENRRGKLLFSEFILSEPFYAGDFVFGGEKSTFGNFVLSNLKIKKFHPSIGVDYILKYLYDHDEINFNQNFNSFLPYLFQLNWAGNHVIAEYWMHLLSNKFLFLKRDVANKMIWRGKSFLDLGFSTFMYEEDREILVCLGFSELNNKSGGILFRTSQNKFFQKVFYEYKKYLRTHFKFRYKKTYQLLRYLYKLFI